MSADVKDIPVGEVTIPMAPGDILVHVIKQTGDVMMMCCSGNGQDPKVGAEAAQAAMRASGV